MKILIDKSNVISPIVKYRQLNATPNLLKRNKLEELTSPNQNANDIKKHISGYAHRQSSSNEDFYINFLRRIREDQNQSKNAKEINNNNALNQSNNKVNTSNGIQKTHSVLNQFTNVKRVSISKKDKISNNITILSKKSEQFSQNKKHSPTHAIREGKEDNPSQSISIDVNNNLSKKSPKRGSIIKQEDQEKEISPKEFCLKTNSLRKNKSNRSYCFLCCIPIKD